MNKTTYFPNFIMFIITYPHCIVLFQMPVYVITNFVRLLIYFIGLNSDELPCKNIEPYYALSGKYRSTLISLVLIITLL